MTADPIANTVEEGQARAILDFCQVSYAAESVEKIYDAALTALERAIGVQRSSILVLDRHRVMRFGAWRGLSETYRQAVEGHSPWPADAKDPEPILVPDVALDPSLSGLAPVFEAERIAALAFVPLVHAGRLLGKFMLYYDAPHGFTESEAELSLTIARQLGFSIERMQADQELRLLVAELNHRVKNTLATVQSLAAQSIRGAGISSGVRESFENRLFALSRAHDQLSQTRWEAADLRSILNDIFEPFHGEDPSRVSLEGAPVSLAPEAALMLAMVLHELATNALKYGSLSSPSGWVEISWRIEGDENNPRLMFSWLERGGPRVGPTGESRGFGSQLISMVGSPRLSFKPEGLEYVLTMPLSDVSGTPHLATVPDSVA